MTKDQHSPRPFRILASGTLFVTHTLSLPVQPAPSTVTRAHSVEKARGGSATSVLTVLAQFPAVVPVLVASLGGNDEARLITRDLQKRGVLTRYCKVWKNLGVPTAWVIQSDDDVRTVINHNPLPDVAHEDFISILGPLLAPENYGFPSPRSSPTSPRPSFAVSPNPQYMSPVPPDLQRASSPAPFEWIHFEGRSVKTTLSNLTGLDSLARERKWRSHCVFSVDVGRRGRQGVEALIPHADVVFFSKHYAQANSPNSSTTPRSFLLSLTSSAAPHSLLVAYWGTEGAAVLSLPTKEYFQSSGWVEQQPEPLLHTSLNQNGAKTRIDPTEMMPSDVTSVRTGSNFWADGRSTTPSSSAFTAAASSSSHTTATSSRNENHLRSPTPSSETGGHRKRDTITTDEFASHPDDGHDSDGTETATDNDDGVVDEVGAQEAFVAGMIYALSRKICPGPPYTPSSNGTASPSDTTDKGKWRLDECLRFATELAGRKARRRGWDGLAAEMIRSGWTEEP